MKESIVKSGTPLCVMEVTGYGDDIIGEVREISKAISVKIDSKTNNQDLLSGLNRVFNSIDYGELKLLNGSHQSGFSKVLDLITKKKDKIVSKYMGISGELDRMYLGVKAWESNLKINNSALQEAKSKTEELQEKLIQYISDGNQRLSEMAICEDSTFEDRELYSLMTQRVQDFQYNLSVSHETIKMIDMMLRSNYTIYRKLLSVYTTSLPTIQNQINMFNILKEHNEMTETLNILDEQKRKLVEFGASESVRIAKKTTEMLDCTKDFDSLKNAIDILENGTKELLSLEESAAKLIASRVKEYKLLGGLVND